MMDERTLLKILKEEEADAASYYSSELASVQEEAMRRFHAEKYGDEITGKSQVVTHDIEDTINWIMPDLMRFLLGSDELVSIEHDAAIDDTLIDQIGQYLNRVVFKDNPGEVELYDFVFDALLMRLGTIKVAWQEKEVLPPEEVKGLTELQLAKYLQKRNQEVIAQTQDEDGTFHLQVKRTTPGRPVLQAIPPEEYSFSRRSKNSKDSDYKCWKREQFLKDILRQYPDSRGDLVDGSSRASADDDHFGETDGRKQERFPDESDDDQRNTETHIARRKVWLSEEEIRVDFDDDDVVELRKIIRVGDVILENVKIEKTELYNFSPIRVSHRLAGRSLTDTLIDIQRIRTVVSRRMLDSLDQSLLPRVAYNSQHVTEDGIDALLDADVGGIVECTGDVRQAIQPLVTPDVTASGYQMLEYQDQRSEEASGVTRHAKGLKAEAITDTADGITKLQSAANARIEMIARWLGKAVEEIYQAVLDLLIAHQEEAQSIMLSGKLVEVNPSLWPEGMTVSIHVGGAGESRQSKLQHLGIVAQKQEGILLEQPNNPLVSLQEYRTTLALMTETMGFKSSERFFKQLPENYEQQPSSEQPNPAVIEAQSKMQLEEKKAQHSAELKEAEFAHRKQMEELDLQKELQVADIKARNERELAEMRIKSEQEIAVMRINAESELARWKAEQEVDLKHLAAAGQNGISEGRPGGRLDQ